MLGPIVFFGSACFVVFAVVYLALVGSTYLFLSNLVFGALCALTWLGHRWRLSHGVIASLFLALVYAGLVNVAVHLGDARSPMVFWGISVGIAAVFLFGLKGQLVWFVLVLAFLPLVQALKGGPFAGRVVALDATQTAILTLATYLGLLTFLTYCFILFRRRLDQALANVKTLSGLLPICASCKRIRDDRGYWSQIESYLKRHTEADFSHGLCPDCVSRLYPELKLDREP
jgi:multisubunit Na+/H+ antiporter MnhF subunit